MYGIMAMQRVPFHKLTPQQSECLRLVFDGKTSKQIAITLQLSPRAVDERLMRAIATLGAPTRRVAAKWLVEFEGQAAASPAPQIATSATPQRLLPQSDDLAAPDPASTVGPSFNRADQQQGQTEGRAVREVRAPFEHDLGQRETKPWPLPFRRSQSHDLTIRQRLAWILTISIGIMLATGVFLSGLDALARLFANPLLQP